MKTNVFQFGDGVELIDIQMPNYRMCVAINWNTMEFFPVFCRSGNNVYDDPDWNVPQEIVDVAIANTQVEE